MAPGIALSTFPDGTFSSGGDAVRSVMEDIQGTDTYRYDGPWEPDPAKLLEDRRFTSFARLAVAGWDAFSGTLVKTNPKADVLGRNAGRERWLISVSGCGDARPSLPWGMLYDLPLDDGGSTRVSTCHLFAADVLAKRDLLDAPGDCRKRQGCPLGDDARKWKVACPFGFWGVLHDVEQPLQGVRTQAAAGPDSAVEAHSRAWLDAQLVARPQPGVDHAADPVLPDVDAHQEELVDAVAPAAVNLKRDRESARALMQAGAQEVLYIYGHAQAPEGNPPAPASLSLRFGRKKYDDYLSASSFDVREGWDGLTKPLVFLNACESVAMRPDLGGDLLFLFRNLGASGIVGTEVKVHSALARRFGANVLRAFFRGATLASALRAARLELLREMNPLGLAFTMHASSALHLHRGNGCSTCAAAGTS